MNAQPLYLHDCETESGFFMCSSCNYPRPSEEMAEECCRERCYICKVEFEGFKGRYGHAHPECYRKQRLEEHAKNIAEAEEVFDYTGPVFEEFNTYNEGYTACLADWISNADFKSFDEIPEFLFCCDLIPFPMLSVNQIVEWTIENIELSDTEGLEHSINVPDNLHKAVEEYNESNKDFVTWMVDKERKVRVPREEVWSRIQESRKELEAIYDKSNENK